MRRILALAFFVVLTAPVAAQERSPVVGLIPKATRPVTLDGKLDEWAGAFVTPVHIGHPRFANRGAQFSFLWDDDNLYVGLWALDQTPAHVAPQTQIFNGDAVEFYLDTRRDAQLGAKDFTAGSLHMFWTPFTGREIKPRLQVRPLPAFKDFTLQGAAVAAAKVGPGWSAEFRLPWKNFPNFTPKAGAILGIDCELCSSDGGARVDRTFVYSSPRSVATPAAFGRVRLVEKITGDDLMPCSRALLPTALTRSANYATLYAQVGVSPTLDKLVSSIEGRIVGAGGKVVRPATKGTRSAALGLPLWTGSWELFDVPPGDYVVEIVGRGAEGRELVRRRVRIAHGSAPTR